MKMAGLFSGVIGSLLESGVQSAIGKALQPEEPKPPEMYTKIAQHLNGALQVVEPCLKLVNALNTVHRPVRPQNFEPPVIHFREEWENNLRASSKAASVKSRGSAAVRESKKPPIVIDLCSPNKKSCRASSYGGRSSEEIQNRQKISELRLRHFSNSEIENNRQPGKENGWSYAVDEKKSKIHPTASSLSTAVDTLSPSQRSQNKPVKTSASGSRLQLGSCQLCRIQLNDVNTPGPMSCSHVYCYRCLTGKNITKCPRCGQNFDLKKIRGFM